MPILNSPALGLLTLRLTVGVLILFHGVAKVMHPDTLNFIGTKLAGIELPEFLAYGVYVGEVLAPLMIIVGYSSRLGGVLVVINMLFAIVLMHGGDVFSLSPHGGWALELQGFYLFGGLAVALLGSGSYAFRPD